MGTDSTYEAQKEDKKNASNKIIDPGGILSPALRAAPSCYSFVSLSY